MTKLIIRPFVLHFGLIAFRKPISADRNAGGRRGLFCESRKGAYTESRPQNKEFAPNHTTREEQTSCPRKHPWSTLNRFENLSLSKNWSAVQRLDFRFKVSTVTLVA